MYCEVISVHVLIIDGAQSIRDSDAISDSRNRPEIVSNDVVTGKCQNVPGIMYVSDRSADSICDTALLFLVMKSEYMPSHLVGCDSTSVAFCLAPLIIFAVAPVRG